MSTTNDQIKTALADLAGTFQRLGKSALADATTGLEEYAQSAVQWEAQRRAAEAVGDVETADQCSRDLGLLVSNAALAVGGAGVQAQAGVEGFVVAVLKVAESAALKAIA